MLIEHRLWLKLIKAKVIPIAMYAKVEIFNKNIILAIIWIGTKIKAICELFQTNNKLHLKLM